MGKSVGNGVIMFKVRLITVGKVKEKYFSEAVEEYAKRLKRFCDFSIIEVKEENFVKEPDFKEAERIKRAEGENILKELRGKTVVFAIEGKECSSEEFAALIKGVKDGAGEISFVIGGSYGVSDEVKKRADYKISFSEMTFPHAMFRVMCIEQIYRGFTIISGAKYHK